MASWTYVEEIDDGDERGVQDCPDNVEFPLQGLNADWSDLDHWAIIALAVRHPQDVSLAGCGRRSRKGIESGRKDCSRRGLIEG